MAQDQMSGASPEQIVGQVVDTIGALAEAASQQRPDVAQKLQQIGQMFMEVMGEFVGGGQGGPRGPQPVAEQGQGMPAGPQGPMR